MTSYRLFIACDFSADTLALAAKRAKDLQALLTGVPIRWVSPELFHLTLKFLGEVPAAKQKEIEIIIASTAAAAAKIPVELAGAGCFPSSREPRVLWLGLRADEQLARLAQNLHRALQPLCFEDEKRFTPHLTIGRLDRVLTADQNARVRAALDQIKDCPPKSDLFKEIVLYRSVLTPRGPVYTPLYRASFQNVLN